MLPEQFSHRRTVLVGAVAFVVSALLIAAAWWQLGQAQPLPQPPSSAGKPYYCLSYAPFRGEQSPFKNSQISAAQIEEDLTHLRTVTDCVRTYSIELGLDQVPAIAQRLGMKVLLGLWLSGQPDKNKVEIDKTVSIANRYPDVARAVVVGNEVLLRGELSGADLGAIIRDVKARVPVPVTYADVWEFWLRNPDLAGAVDFVTIHVLPYWEDQPLPAAAAPAHLKAIHDRVAAAFPGKEVVIGEYGWPSAGRMREGALPSPVNQARVIGEGVALAARNSFRLNVIEAYDQPWKRLLEGTVGGYWGLFDAWTRARKFTLGEPLSNHPAWPWQAAGGITFAALIIAAAGLAARRQGTTLTPARGLGLTLTATLCGITVGWAAANVPVQSLGVGGWLRSLVLMALAGAGPVVGAWVIGGKWTVAGFADVLAGRGPRRGHRVERLAAWVLIGVTVLALEAALGLTFNPRYRDIPFAPLTAAVVPFLVAALAQRGPLLGRAAAETAAAVVLALAAVYVALNETFANWQALWFAVVVLALAVTLARARAVPD